MSSEDGLDELQSTGKTAKIASKYHARLIERLGVLNASQTIENMRIPGWKLHPLKGMSPVRYSIKVSGAWRLTFEFEGGNAYHVKFEQYH